MTIFRTVLATLFTLVALVMALVYMGPIIAAIYGSAIAAVVLIVLVANRQTSGSVKRSPHATERVVVGTLWAVIAVWLAIWGEGPHQPAGPTLGMTFTVITIATAVLLNVSLNAGGERQ